MRQSSYPRQPFDERLNVRSSASVPRSSTRERKLAKRAVVTALALFFVNQSSCGSGTGTQKAPNAALSESPEAQEEFRVIADQWHNETEAKRLLLEPKFREFLDAHPTDSQRRLAKAYLAWILFELGRFLEAQRMMEEPRRGPRGAARDFAIVVESALMTHYGRPLEAIKQLRKLQGKIVDRTERFIATEALVSAAVAAKLHAEALIYMLDWVEQAPIHHQERVRESIQSRIHHFPLKVMVAALETLAPKSERPVTVMAKQRREHQSWLYAAVSELVAAHALSQQDVELAQRVVAKYPELRTSTTATELRRLSAGGKTVLQLSGRTIGLVMRDDDARQRRVSAALSTGLNTYLRLEQLEGEISVVAAVARNADEQKQALDELVYQGASLLIAGSDEDAAWGAVRYSAQTGVPTFLLHPSPQESPAGSRVWALGLSALQEQAILNAVLMERKNLSSGKLFDSDSDYCQAALQTSATASFPFSQWENEGILSLVVLDDTACARSLAEAVSARRQPIEVVLGLGAAELWELFPSAHCWTLQTGEFPLEQGTEDRLHWIEATGHAPSWEEALGRDAAALGAAALIELDELYSKDPTVVTRFYSQLNARLLLASPVLWTTNQRGKLLKKPQLDRDISLLPAEKLAAQ